MRKFILMLTLLVSFFSVCEARPRIHRGMVSWYNLRGGSTGIRMASKYYDCGSVFMVRNARDKTQPFKRAIVDNYGPFYGNRPFDFSPYLFRRTFGFTSKGVCELEYYLVKRGKRCRIHRHDGTY